MGTTKFEKLDLGRADIAAFRISGTLGFHENTKVQRLIEECMKRNFTRVLFDFTGLTSLGGGVAKILRDFVTRFGERGGEAGFIVTSGVILEFLRDGLTPFATFGSLDEALGAPSYAAGGSAPPHVGESVDEAAGTAAEGAPDRPGAADGSADRAAAGEGSSHRVEGTGTPDGAGSGVILMPYDGAEQSGDGGIAETPQSAGGAGGAAGNGGAEKEARGRDRGRENGEVAADVVFSEIFGENEAAGSQEWIGRPVPSCGDAIDPGNGDEDRVAELNRKLKRRILEFKTLFSISKDFNAIRDRKKLLDIFLLTSIAQGGVESAVFFERRGDQFEPVMSKGVDADRIEPIDASFRDAAGSCNDSTVVPLDDCEINGETRDALKRVGLEYVSTFRQEGEVTGLVLYGKRIAGRGMKREDFEFLQILITIAQGAYENAVMFDHEHERTLGIVKTLISLIEENTLLKGTSEFVSRYVGLVAKNMGYPEEAFKDLIYGTVLRDMGMIKISDLILRSPRDLTKDEWEIIKKHPEDGAEMLRRMKFSDRVVGIVKAHHERFNGEGYPMGLVGKEIPLGARIISVVESYAAMIHERPNRPALSEREALDVLKENYGLRYDREVVHHFNRIMEKEIAKAVRPEAQVGS